VRTIMQIFVCDDVVLRVVHTFALLRQHAHLVHHFCHPIHPNDFLDVSLSAQAVQSDHEFAIFIYATLPVWLATEALAARPKREQNPIEQVAGVICAEFAPGSHPFIVARLRVAHPIAPDIESQRWLRIRSTVQTIDHQMTLEVPLVAGDDDGGATKG